MVILLLLDLSQLDICVRMLLSKPDLQISPLITNDIRRNVEKKV